MTRIGDWVKKLPGGRSRERRGRFYRYSLILALCMASIPTALIAAASYALGTAHIEREVMASHRTLVERSAARLDELFDQLELSASQWSLDPRLGSTLKRANLSMEYQRTNELYRFLGLMKATYPRLEDARLLLNRSEPLLLSESGGVRQISFAEDRKRFQELVERHADLYWIEDFRWTASDPGSVVLVRKLPGYGAPYGALLLSLDRGKLEEFVGEASFEDKSASYLYAEGGRSVIRVADGMPEDRLFESSLREELSSRASDGEKPSDSYLFKWRGKTYSVSYSLLQRPGAVWTYATVSPIEALTRPVVMLSRSLLGVSLASMLLALLLAWLASRRLHLPIRRLADMLGASRAAEPQPGRSRRRGLRGLLRQGGEEDYDELRHIERSWRELEGAKREAEARLERTYPELRAAFFMQLMQGHYRSLDERELLPRMAHFGWPLESGERLFVVLLRVGVLSPPESQFRDEDELLMTFAAANLVREFIGQRRDRAEVVNFQDGSVAALIPYTEPDEGTASEVRKHGGAPPESGRWTEPGETAGFRPTAAGENVMFHAGTSFEAGIVSPGGGQSAPDSARKALAEELASVVRATLRLRTVVCTGEAGGILEVPELLHALRGVLRGVPDAESCRVLHLGELLPGAGAGGAYPFALEKELIQEVRLGRIGEASGLTGNFVAELSRRSASEAELREGALHLLGSLLHVMLENGARPEGAEGADLYERLLELRQPEAIEAFLRLRVLEPYGRELEAGRQLETGRLAERVRLELERDYTADFSLERCAERFGVSPYALSRSFKQTYGQTFVDYVMTLRLDKGRELLRTTDLKVNEIAEAVGYHPSYFIRLFRKQEGMTPGQYRAEKEG
ncbi:AraC family transcriptional regulator [Saccharibacillus sp. CPCC 101409]|uniref:AraC family transcriptional regulator n=1 Tax=Saccharibacillus sp. CPCC 101409 TaxID=3058041 RepID=UPI0026713462|nr:AraC family transcriptional regulator [Saccharibacillus sp. CPCC 101409]MDO3411155.1 AraC family transcriptional regulator [Saccharibacillus sp. CPCC 101409]